MKKIFPFFKYILIAVGCVCFVILKSGVWAMPNIETQYRVSQSLTANPFLEADEQYLFQNYFSPFVFGTLGGKSLISFMLFSAVTALLFLMTFAAWFVKYHGEEIAIKRYGLLTALVFPVFAIPFYWLGMDGMTLLLILAVLISLQRSAWMILSACFATLLAFQHFEQAVASFSLLLFTLLIPLAWKNKSQNNYLYKILWVVFWVVMGKVIMMVIFRLLGIDILGDRFAFMQKYLVEFLNQWRAGWPWILYTIFGTGWLLILFHWRESWPILGVGAFVFFASLIFGDQNRFSSIVTLPTLFYWFFANRQIWKSSNTIHGGTIILYIVIPFVYVWGGQTFGSMYKYDIELIKKIDLTTLEICGNSSPWTPFLKSDRTSDSFFSYSATLEEGIDFSRSGYPYFLCRVRGISFQENWGRWTDEKKVVLFFREPLPKNFDLHILIASVSSPNLYDSIIIHVGDETHKYILDKDGFQEVVLNFSLTQDTSQIVIIIPDSASLLELGLGSDAREVGIGIQRLWIVER